MKETFLLSETTLFSCLFHKNTDICRLWHQKTFFFKFSSTRSSFVLLNVDLLECTGCKMDQN